MCRLAIGTSRGRRASRAHIHTYSHTHIHSAAGSPDHTQRDLRHALASLWKAGSEEVSVSVLYLSRCRCRQVEGHQ